MSSSAKADVETLRAPASAFSRSRTSGRRKLIDTRFTMTPLYPSAVLA